MKYFVLFLKAALLVFLVMVRLGEIDLSFLMVKAKYRTSYEYYLDTFASIVSFLLLLDFIQVSAIWIYRRRHKIRGDDNFIIGIGQIYTILIYLGMLLGLLAMFRVEIKEVFTSLSIIFAGLVLLTKEYVSNLINGMIITFSGQMSIGDNVRIGLHKGRIMDITLQSIHLLNDDDDYIYIPNNLVFTTEVVNFTKRHIKRTSIEFEIDLKYLKTVEELENILIDTLRPFHNLINADSYYLRVAEVKRDLVQMKFQYILKKPDKELERQIRRKTVRRLVEIIAAREKFVDNIADLPEEITDIFDPPLGT